jgi:CheY-like chemotaxis protein
VTTTTTVTTPGVDLAGLRLLVVEDEALVAMMVETILADLGCAVVGPVGRLAAALELVATEALDGAIVDVNVGGEQAYPLADALSAAGVPFVFATGYGRAGIDQRYAGVPVLQKPFEEAALERAVAGLVADPRLGSAAPTLAPGDVDSPSRPPVNR